MSYPAGCTTSQIDLSSNGDVDPIDELDELCVLDCGHSGTLRGAEQTGGEVICEPCFLERKAHPVQLPDFQDAKWKSLRMMNALHNLCSRCSEPAVGHCDNCNHRFCSDHGTPGGDRQTEDVGAVAYPSVCWKCGGFNADE